MGDDQAELSFDPAIEDEEDERYRKEVADNEAARATLNDRARVSSAAVTALVEAIRRCQSAASFVPFPLPESYPTELARAVLAWAAAHQELRGSFEEFDKDQFLAELLVSQQAGEDQVRKEIGLAIDILGKGFAGNKPILVVCCRRACKEKWIQSLTWLDVLEGRLRRPEDRPLVMQEQSQPAENHKSAHEERGPEDALKRFAIADSGEGWHTFFCKQGSWQKRKQLKLRKGRGSDRGIQVKLLELFRKGEDVIDKDEAIHLLWPNEDRPTDQPILLRRLKSDVSALAKTVKNALDASFAEIKFYESSGNSFRLNIRCLNASLEDSDLATQDPKWRLTRNSDASDW